MSVDKKDLQKICQLAKLSLTDDEACSTLVSLNAVLTLLDELQSADVSSIDEMAYVQGHGQTLRYRAATPVEGFSHDDLFSNAPQSENDHFIVPKVIE